MLVRPSQHSSLRGMRTVLAFQSAIALTDASSTGPSKMPRPWTHMNSPPEPLPPSSRRVDPFSSTNTMPETRSFGGVPVWPGGGSVGSAGSVGPEPPSHATPLSRNAEGDGLEPDQEAVKPALTLPPVATFPFQRSEERR